MLFIALFVLIAIVAIVAICMLFARVDAIKTERRRASASHAYLSINQYSKWEK